MIQYLMQYVDEYDFTKSTRYKIVLAEANLTWRQLQQKFDPDYHYDNLVFYNLGSKIK